MRVLSPPENNVPSTAIVECGVVNDLHLWSKQEMRRRNCVLRRETARVLKFAAGISSTKCMFF